DLGKSWQVVLQYLGRCMQRSFFFGLVFVCDSGRCGGRGWVRVGGCCAGTEFSQLECVNFPRAGISLSSLLKECQACTYTIDIERIKFNLVIFTWIFSKLSLPMTKI